MSARLLWTLFGFSLGLSAGFVVSNHATASDDEIIAVESIVETFDPPIPTAMAGVIQPDQVR